MKKQWLLYVIGIIILFTTQTGCKKRVVIPASKLDGSKTITRKINSQSLGELFNNNFHCYRVKYPSSNTYHFNTSVNNDFLASWNITPSEFDLNDDQLINTQDMLLNLTGFNNPQPEYPSFLDFTPFQTFGEGNTWLTYNGLDNNIVFGWMHRTPYDETNEVSYNGYDNIYTWTLDVVTENDIVFYYFVEI